ncbi:MAG TPA: HAD family hydrolase [Chthoniobacteraceae bacterium]|jgi:histidinol-phosphate phosphatase family protein|nr:HAD family hydrolase [Chthoniobacteraceae bacterium]
MSAPAVFLDRDGTLMVEVDYCRDPARVELLPGVPEGLARLHAAGYRLVVITNQSGIGRGLITAAEYEAVHARLLGLIGPGLIDATYYCPDHPDQASERRKPAPGMLLEAAHDLGLDLGASYLIGDKASDLECARTAGARGVLVRSGYGDAEAAKVGDGGAFIAQDFAAAVAHILGARR